MSKISSYLELISRNANSSHLIHKLSSLAYAGMVEMQGIGAVAHRGPWPCGRFITADLLNSQR